MAKAEAFLLEESKTHLEDLGWLGLLDGPTHSSFQLPPTGLAARLMKVAVDLEARRWTLLEAS